MTKGGSTSDSDKSTQSKNAKTADETPVEALVSLLGISAGLTCLMLVVMLRRKRD